MVSSNSSGDVYMGVQILILLFFRCEIVGKLYALAKSQLLYLKMRETVLNSQCCYENSMRRYICYALSTMPGR